MNKTDRIKKFGFSSTMFMIASESRRGLERTLSHTSTRASTSAKVAVGKTRGGKIRGMKVLSTLNRLTNRSYLTCVDGEMEIKTVDAAANGLGRIVD